ncbi:MAG TPA: chemotaxis response regulator protein-glutamate methylesterase [Bacteroidota bacterium]|nr:chemotaxis response regulator protein-glutamate methylesterase [Bacteroidota bacterium]
MDAVAGVQAERAISVVVIDDSAFMRKSISMMLESDPGIKVVATARDGQDGINKIREFHPDIATLDVEMPVMDGLTALRVIMKEMPLPVIMISSLTSEGAQATLDALNIGAVDFIPKELSYVSVDIKKIKEDLIAKVRSIVRSRARRLRPAGPKIQPRAPVAHAGRLWNVATGAGKSLKAAVLGISTGGPFALLQTIPKLPADYPLGIAIVQHMPPRFTKSLADRLDGLSALHVQEAGDGDVLVPGVVLIAPGGRHMTFRRKGGDVAVCVTEEPSNTLYRPSADIMISSAVDVFNAPLLGIIMTGMGKDGLEGLRRLKAKGGVVFAQDEESCVVYGMPRAAVDDGIADAILPLDAIPGGMTRLFN